MPWRPTTTLLEKRVRLEGVWRVVVRVRARWWLGVEGEEEEERRRRKRRREKRKPRTRLMRQQRKWKSSHGMEEESLPVE